MLCENTSGRLEIRAREERDRAGYSKHPQQMNDALLWEKEGASPAK